MTHEIDLSAVNIPYGVLHDQCLTGVKCKDSVMVFSFDLDVYPSNYHEDFYKQYESFQRCEMSIEMLDDRRMNFFTFYTCISRHGKVKGLSLSQDEFLEAINSRIAAGTEVTFIDCSVACNSVEIGFSMFDRDVKGKTNKYKKYRSCNAGFYASKIKWTWY